MVNNDTYEILVEEIGLKKILEQNDIEEWEELRFLFEGGFLDTNEYIYTWLPDIELEDED